MWKGKREKGKGNLFSLSPCVLAADESTGHGKHIGTIKPKTRRGLEVGFLQETRLLGVRFIYAHLLIQDFCVD